MIAHILDSRPNGKTIFSDFSINLGESPILTDYFQNQIIKISKDSAASLAILADEYVEEMTPIYQQIISESNQPNSFINASKVLGERLYEIMVGDKRIKAGDLVICTFTTENFPSITMFAILKLDLTHAVRHKPKKIAKNRWEVTLHPISDALPSLGERLQKAAILIKKENPGWELLVLDRQVAEPETSPAAYFFLRRFLGAEWQLTPEAQTNRFFGSVAGVAAALYKREEVESWTEAANIFQSIEVALDSERIDRKNFVQNLPVHEKTKDLVHESLMEANLDNEIVVDRDTAAKLTGKVRYQGEGDLLLTASSDVYDQLVDEEGPEEGENQSYVITIRTRRWQRLKSRRR
jgi:hypothetical protein